MSYLIFPGAEPTILTAAIGDGGNDVSMLQEAHVGLAIIGKEGTAAAQASDFAFTKFKYLSWFMATGIMCEPHS